MAGNKIYSVLMVVLLTIIVSAILYSNNDRVAQYIYAQDTHAITLLNGSTVESPDPFLPTDLQVQIWYLAPLGVILGGAFAIFLMMFKRH